MALYALDFFSWKHEQDPTHHVKNIIIGPELHLKQWDRTGNQGMHQIVLKSLIPWASLWYDDQPLPGEWIHIRRAIITHLYPIATMQKSKNLFFKKMNHFAQWVTHQDAILYQRMRNVMLERMNIKANQSLVFERIPVHSLKTHHFAQVQKPILTLIDRQSEPWHFDDLTHQYMSDLLTWLSTYYTIRHVKMRDFSVEKQIQLAASSDVILGIHGEDLAHSFWSPPSSYLVEIFPRHGCKYEFQWLSHSCGHTWIGLREDGLMAPGHFGYCFSEVENALDSTEIQFHVEALRGALMTIRNIFNRNPFQV